MAGEYPDQLEMRKILEMEATTEALEIHEMNGSKLEELKIHIHSISLKNQLASRSSSCRILNYQSWRMSR